MTETRLCALADIPDNGSAGFNTETQALLAVRRGDNVVVYVNSCPHIGAPLDFQPGQFLNVEKTHIQCSTHGALFNIDDGRCVRGPCADQALDAVLCTVRDGAVFIGG